MEAAGGTEAAEPAAAPGEAEPTTCTYCNMV